MDSQEVVTPVKLVPAGFKRGTGVQAFSKVIEKTGFRLSPE
jgi:hypothetical protein